MTRPTILVRITIAAVATIYSAVLYVSGDALDSTWIRVLAGLPLVGGIALWLWDTAIWRVPFIQRATRRPYVGGLWRVTYRPTADSHIPDGGNRGPIPGYMVIRQSFWYVTIRSYTEQSKSDSRSFFWETRPGNDFATLTFTYENVPRESESHRSTRHLGANQLDTAGASPKSIEGSYFTDRYTKGDMELVLVDRSHGYGSFSQCKEHAESSLAS